MVNLRIRRPETPARRGARIWPDLSDFEQEFFSPLSWWMTRPAEALAEQAWAPRVDIIEKEDQWIFKGELPDVKPEDIQVTIEEGVLAIKGERKFEEEVKEGSYTRFERQYGSFERRFSLPSGIDADSIKADYKNGVLTLRVPKKEEAKPKSIKIES